MKIIFDTHKTQNILYTRLRIKPKALTIIETFDGIKKI